MPFRSVSASSDKKCASLCLGHYADNSGETERCMGALLIAGQCRMYAEEPGELEDCTNAITITFEDTDKVSL